MALAEEDKERLEENRNLNQLVGANLSESADHVKRALTTRFKSQFTFLPHFEDLRESYATSRPLMASSDPKCDQRIAAAQPGVSNV